MVVSTCLILFREAVDGGGLVAVSGLEDGSGEAWLVRAVWIVLSFQAEAAAVDVGFA